MGFWKAIFHQYWNVDKYRASIFPSNIAITFEQEALIVDARRDKWPQVHKTRTLNKTNLTNTPKATKWRSSDANY